MDAVIKTYIRYENKTKIKSATNGIASGIKNFMNKLMDAPSMTDTTVFDSKDWPYLWKKNNQL